MKSHEKWGKINENMKTRIIIFLVLFIFTQHSQGFSQEFLTITRTITVLPSLAGILATDGEGKEVSLSCTNYKIPTGLEIPFCFIDSARSELVLFARKSGNESFNLPVYIMAYDYQKEELLWAKQGKYLKGINGFLTKNLVVFRVKTAQMWKNYAFGKSDGQIVWKNNFELRSPIISRDIAFDGSLKCIDLSTGKTKWKRKISDDYGWMENIFLGNDMLAMADGAHRINLDDGTGWDVEMPTGKVESTDMMAQMIIGGWGTGLSGMWDYMEPENKRVAGYPGNYAINCSGAYIRTGLGSNILLDQDRFYFSAMDKLVYADLKTGKKIWQLPLTEPMTGRVFLDLKGDNLIFINQGCGFRNKELRTYFVPYIHILNNKTGKSLFSNNVKTSFMPVLDYIIADTLIHLMTQNDIYTFNMKCILTEKLSSSRDSSLRYSTGHFLSFLPQRMWNDFWVKPGNKSNQVKNLTTLHDEGAVYFLMTEKGLVCLDANLHAISWISEDNVFRCLYRFSDKCLLAPVKKYATQRMIIPDKNSSEIMFHLNLTCKSEISEGHLLLFSTPNSISMLPFSVFDKNE